MPSPGGKHISWLLTIPSCMLHAHIDEATGHAIEDIGPLHANHSTLEVTYDGNNIDNCIKFVRGQLEEGDQKDGDGVGYVHWQVFVSFYKQVTLAHVKKVFDRDDLHAVDVKSKNNGLERACEYVHKDDSFIGMRFQFGDKKRVGSGNHRSMEDAAQLVMQGKTLPEIADIDPLMVMKWHRGMQVLRTVRFPAIRRSFSDIKVTWVHGDTGSGKTLLVGRLLEEAGISMESEVYWVGDLKAGKSCWWDGYAGQRVVVFDDFDEDNWTVEQLFRFFDGTPCRVPVKGSSEPFNGVTFFFTSRSAPDGVYESNRQYDAWKRRFYGVGEDLRGRMPGVEIVDAAQYWGPDGPAV